MLIFLPISSLIIILKDLRLLFPINQQIHKSDNYFMISDNYIMRCVKKSTQVKHNGLKVSY